MQSKAYAVLARSILAPEGIIRVESMEGVPFYDWAHAREREREQRRPRIELHRQILEEEGELIAKRWPGQRANDTTTPDVAKAFRASGVNTRG